MVLLDLSYKNLTKIPIIHNDVTKLNLSHNKMINLVQGCFSLGLQELHLNNDKIIKIENLPDSLQILWLNNNQITKIENLPDILQELHIDNNRIIKIENLPNSLQKLYLYNNQITKIENLPDSLQELRLQYNQITKIENLPDSLQELWLGYNQITKIENLPENLLTLYLEKNQITKIENLSENLQTLYLEKNQITKIENLPENLRILYLEKNQITKIGNLPSSIRNLWLHNNQILELPLSLLELRHLTAFKYCYNPIENIHPLVQRWLDRLNRGTIGGNNKVYSDGQNIHNSTIQKSFRESLGNLLKDENTLSLEECKKHVLERNELEEQTKRELLNYCDDDTEHPVYLVKFDEVFRYVISRIVKHPESTEMFKILNEEIKDTICKCFTGRMTRLVNVLNGFYGDITIQIGSNEQISNIIIMLKEKYEGDELVEKVRLEMEEREYDNETIEEWLTYVE